jgi:hypothetical protein
MLEFLPERNVRSDVELLATTWVAFTRLNVLPFERVNAKTLSFVIIMFSW